MDHVNNPEEGSGFQKAGFLNREFMVFHLKDKPDRTFEFHYHDFYKILVFLEGNVNYIIEGRTYTLRPYDIVLVGRGRIHRPEADSSSAYERIILYLSQEFFDRCHEEGAGLDNCFSTAAYRHSDVLRLKEEVLHPAISLLKRMKRAQDWQTEDFAGPLYTRVLCLEFLIELNRAALEANAQYLPTGTLNYRVSGLISYINEHLAEDLSIKTLSAVSCTSSYHMMRIFKEETGCTIGNYITEKRLKKARELLADGTKATEACYLSGFNNYSTFLRAYKSRFHCLPRRVQE